MTTERRSFIAGVAAAVLLPALARAQDAPPPTLPRVVLETTAGRVVIEIDNVRAPITGNNFLRYVDNRRYDGGTFYRAFGEPDIPEFGIVQGGMRGNTQRPFPPIAHEPTTQTGILHKRGVISMGRTTPGSATSDFFIMMGDAESMDANPSAEGDNLGFAAFGRVVEGMDVLRNIQLMPKSPDAEVPAMRGQMLATPIRITTAQRLTPQP